MSDLTSLAFIALLSELANGQGGGGGGQPVPGPPGPPGPPAPWVGPDLPPPPMPDVPPAPSPMPDVYVPTVDPAAGDHGARKMPPPGDRPWSPPVPHAPVVPPGGGVVPPMPPWPRPPVPTGLPPFPGPAWVPDLPVTPAVAARATYWNAILWNFATRTIRQPYAQEQMNGQWVTFSAAWHPGDKGPQTFMATEAWRLASSPPVAPPAPVPVVPVAPVAPPAPALTPLQQAAADMNAALASNGYRQSDQPLYKAFQHAAGLTPDGFPGSHTMATLASVLQSAGMSIATVHVYPWSSRGGYDGSNAPTLAEWNR